MFISDQLIECCDAYLGCQEMEALVRTLKIMQSLSNADVAVSGIVIILISSSKTEI